MGLFHLNIPTLHPLKEDIDYISGDIIPKLWIWLNLPLYFISSRSKKSRLKLPEMSYIPRLSNDLQKTLKYFLRACKAILIASPTTLKFHPRLSCNLNDVYCFRYFLPSPKQRPLGPVVRYICCTLYLLAALDRRESYSRRWLATIFHRPLTRHSSFYFLVKSLSSSKAEVTN